MTRKPLAEKSFVVDSMLGKMSKWLRILGFDAHCEHLTSQQQIKRYQEEGRLVVTRRERWCKLGGVIGVSSNDPMEQLRELATGISLKPEEMGLFRRCIVCNEQLNPVPRNEVFGLVPDYIFEIQNTFYQCSKCKRLFWSGSHPKRMLKRLKDVLGWNLQNSDA